MPTTFRTKNTRYSAQPQTTKTSRREVIVLSSDDEEPPSKKLKMTKKGPSRAKAKSRSVGHEASGEDVIEVTDSADGPSVPCTVQSPNKTSYTTTTMLAARNKTLEDANRALKKELKTLRASIARNVAKACMPELEFVLWSRVLCEMPPRVVQYFHPEANGSVAGKTTEARARLPIVPPTRAQCSERGVCDQKRGKESGEGAGRE
ncbi:hypothetical protein EIP86_006987 [Pleurotus ostreatoroseus]|nr:hypothetical protein EIP86_006987 [Pleurotus ostreatoroseus]